MSTVAWLVMRRHRDHGEVDYYMGDGQVAVAWETEEAAEDAIVELGLDQDPRYDVVPVPATKRSTN